MLIFKMEENKILDAIHGATLNYSVRKIKELKDFYSDVTYVSLKNLNLVKVKETKEVMEWILQHPNYDFNSLLPTIYSNEELYEYLKVYYENILFEIDCYNRGKFIIKPSDFE